MLGAWIGNKTKDLTPWEPIIDKISTKLERWRKVHPTLSGRKIIMQMVVGGHTQFLTQAQGMPKETEDTLNRMIKNFIWEDNSSPRIAKETLRNPITEGGLNLCHRLSMRMNCSTIWTTVRADWSGVVFPTMRVSSMTLAYVKAQVAFPPLNPSAL